MSLTEQKSTARKTALARRKAAHAAGGDGAANARLLDYLEPHRGKVLAGYMAMRSEIDPLAAMTQMARFSPVAVPVIEGAGKALKFRQWSPDSTLEEGPFGAKVPTSGAWLEPQVLIVPLVAFDRTGGRLGYGGGFYDRTLTALRARRPTKAVGFAYAAQEAQGLPLEATDQPLDAVVTERSVIRF